MPEYKLGQRWETAHDGIGEIVFLFPAHTLVELQMDSGKKLIFPHEALLNEAPDPLDNVKEEDRARVRHAATLLAYDRAAVKRVDFTGPSAQDYYDVLTVIKYLREYDEKKGNK